MVQLTNNWHQPEQWSLLNALTNAIELRQAELCDKSVSIGLDVDPQASRAPCPVALREAIDCIMGLAVARSPAGGDIHISLCQTGQAFEIEIADCGDDSLVAKRTCIFATRLRAIAGTVYRSTGRGGLRHRLSSGRHGLDDRCPAAFGTREGRLNMWGTWLNNSTLPALEQTAAFAQKRHMLLAGNIANLDVPGYRTRDISLDDFQQALRTAVEQQASPSSGYRSPGGFQSSEAMSPEPCPLSPEAMERVRDVSKQVIFHDGSDVSLEEQVTEISKNQSLHDMSIALMRSQLQTLQAAIRESASV